MSAPTRGVSGARTAPPYGGLRAVNQSDGRRLRAWARDTGHATRTYMTEVARRPGLLPALQPSMPRDIAAPDERLTGGSATRPSASAQVPTTVDAGHASGTYSPDSSRGADCCGRRTSGAALRPELPPWTCAMGPLYLLGVALLTDVFSDLLEVLLRGGLVVREPPSSRLPPLTHASRYPSGPLGPESPPAATMVAHSMGRVPGVGGGDPFGEIALGLVAALMAEQPRLVLTGDTISHPFVATTSVDAHSSLITE